MIVSGENVKKLFSQSNLTPAVLMKVRSIFFKFFCRFTNLPVPNKKATWRKKNFSKRSR